MGGSTTRCIRYLAIKDKSYKSYKPIRDASSDTEGMFSKRVCVELRLFKDKQRLKQRKSNEAILIGVLINKKYAMRCLQEVLPL